LEIESGLGSALAAPASADSAAKGKSKFAESRRFIKKKFEPTLFATTESSWQLFSARATFCALLCAGYEVCYCFDPIWVV